MKEIISTKAPSAIGPYSQAMEFNGMVFVSGQIPLNPVTGILVEDVKEATKQSMENIKAILEEAGTNMSNVIKTTILLRDMSDFSIVNEVYETFLTKPYPARATFAVKELPKNAVVEIEAIAKK